MNRKFILGVGLLLLLLCGCYESPDKSIDRDVELSDGIEISSTYTKAGFLEKGVDDYVRKAGNDPGDPLTSLSVLITNESAASELTAQREMDREFLETVDFSSGYLVVAQYYGMPSAKWMAVTRVERIEETIHVDIVTRSPEQPYGDDFAYHSLAIYIKDDAQTKPTKAAVTIDGNPVNITV